ncbi:hypothetical protein LCGC14_2240460 [marine sediment metagenome]|uniref:Uncharacterized protein n=1 Tax=marine sediment metagenome TaxID=412755 RepID=A0A0F9D5B4_9ZZZZ
MVGDRVTQSRYRTRTFRVGAVFGAIDVKVELGYRRYITRFQVENESNAVTVFRMHQDIPAGEVGAPVAMPATPNLKVGENLTARQHLDPEIGNYDNPLYGIDGGRQIWVQTTAGVVLVSMTYYDLES